STGEFPTAEPPPCDPPGRPPPPCKLGIRNFCRAGCDWLTSNSLPAIMELDKLPRRAIDDALAGVAGHRVEVLEAGTRAAQTLLVLLHRLVKLRVRTGAVRLDAHRELPGPRQRLNDTVGGKAVVVRVADAYRRDDRQAGIDLCPAHPADLAIT